MKMLSSVGWKLCIVAMLLPWWAGCSTVRLTYGQGPVLAYWWLDGYVDFSSEQGSRVKDTLEDWFAWHRATELPDYATLLASVQRLAVDDVTPAQVCRYVDEGEQRMERAFAQAVPAMAEIVQGFSPAQLRHLEQRYAKGNDELMRDHLQRPAAERQEAALKRWQERAESFYGPLEDAQRRLLVDGLAASPFDARVWLHERRLRQLDIVSGLRRLLAEHAEPAQVQAALHAFGAQVRTSPRHDYRGYRERLAQHNCALVARLHNSASTSQRKRAIDKLKEWESDLRSLVRTAGAVRRPAAPTPAAD